MNYLYFVIKSAFIFFFFFFLKKGPYELAIPGLVNALKLLEPIKDKYPEVTYADLFQLASATAIEVIIFMLKFQFTFYSSF